MTKQPETPANSSCLLWAERVCPRSKTQSVSERVSSKLLKLCHSSVPLKPLVKTRNDGTALSFIKWLP